MKLKNSILASINNSPGKRRISKGRLMVNYYIITGTSKGLGKAIAKKLIWDNNYLFCISRTKNEELIFMSANSNCKVEYIEFDLTCLEEIENLIKTIFTKINSEDAESISLINNAGVLHPIKPIGKALSSDIIDNIGLNAIAPMILTSEFINHTEGLDCQRIIVNISSGAGKNPYFGWGCYCSSKAAIDMFTRCVGIEQRNTSNPVKIISFSPGIIDTDMQSEIRQSKNEDFELVERFIKYKEEGSLRSADFVAQKVLELIDNGVESGKLYDIKELI